MDFGIFDHVERKKDLPLAETYRERRTLAKLADEAGCYCYHVSEHHGTPLSMAPSPNVLLAALASDTERIHIGPLGVLLPLYEPLRLVEEVCMLDQLSGGRLELGIGRGVSKIEVKFYNVDPDRSRAMFDEALEVLKRGLTQPTLDFTGEFYDYDTVPMELSPAQQPHPPIWYPTSNLQSVPWVAKSGFNTIFAGELDHIAEQVAVYLENLDPALRGTARFGVHPFIVVAPTDAEAFDVGEAAYRSHHDNLSYLSKWQGRRGQLTRTQNLKAPATLRQAVDQGWAAAGSPEAVRDQLGDILGKTGCNYVLYTPISGNTPLEFALRALDLFAGKVLPGLS
jgi:alkanesulfonate monooxygenase SsuD/methylene tetrahydromethanopterin reductase-like flavin-dependent oxidoreductase (luciferase family)